MNLLKLRIITATIIISLFAFIFVDFWGLTPNWLINTLTRLQFTPTLIKFIATLGVLSSGFIVIALLNVIWGRVYCSFLCPLGIFQDILSRIAQKFRKRKIFRFSKPHNILRYTIVALFVFSILLGSMLLVNLLDPYSNFGKIFSGLVRPVVNQIFNLFTKALDKIHVYSLFPIELKYSVWQVFVYPVVLLGLLVVLSWQRGRLFCNTLCPVGGILSIFSKISVFKIKIDETACTRCGKCSTVCKAECIDVKQKKVDFSRCVTCFNCIQVCSENGIHYKYSLSAKQVTRNTTDNVVTENGRRQFMGKFVIGMGGIGSLMLYKKTNAQEVHEKPKQPSKIKNEKHYAVCPPGSISIRNFTARCTACHLCVSACPTHVLQPSNNQYGITGIMQPTMDYHKSFCNYECTQCSEVCPTGAIMPLNVEQKKITQTGVVLFIKESCVVFTDETSCGACSEHCPTKAVQMVAYKGNLTIPHTNRDICIGCGACEYACPVRPYRAIYVDGNNIHMQAQKPKEEKLEDMMLEEFPF